MTDIGNSVYGVDMPPTAFDQDWTVIANIASSSYAASQTDVPEVGVAFQAATSGRALLCLSAGVRNNAATNERVVVSYKLYEDSSSGNNTVAASADNGIISIGVASSQEFQYLCTYDLLSGLTPGRQYYAQVVYRSINAAGTGDISSRQITIIPMP